MISRLHLFMTGIFQSVDCRDDTISLYWNGKFLDVHVSNIETWGDMTIIFRGCLNFIGIASVAGSTYSSDSSDSSDIAMAINLTVLFKKYLKTETPMIYMPDSVHVNAEQITKAIRDLSHALAVSCPIYFLASF